MILVEPVFRICYVVWRDAALFRSAPEPRHGWYKLDDIEALIDRDWPWMKTVGWLVHQDDEKVVVSPTVCWNAAGDLLVIPRGMVADLRIMEDPPADPENGPVPVVVPGQPVEPVSQGSPVAGSVNPANLLQGEPNQGQGATESDTPMETYPVIQFAQNGQNQGQGEIVSFWEGGDPDEPGKQSAV